MYSIRSQGQLSQVPGVYFQRSGVRLPIIKALGEGLRFKFQQILRVVASLSNEPCRTVLP